MAVGFYLDESSPDRVVNAFVNRIKTVIVLGLDEFFWRSSMGEVWDQRLRMSCEGLEFAEFGGGIGESSVGEGRIEDFTAARFEGTFGSDRIKMLANRVIDFELLVRRHELVTAARLKGGDRKSVV